MRYTPGFTWHEEDAKVNSIVTPGSAVAPNCNMTERPRDGGNKAGAAIM